MRITALYDQGTAEFLEDKVILHLPIVGVADGVSGVYSPAKGPRFFGARTGGQEVVSLVDKISLERSQSQEPLKDIVFEMNQAVAEFARREAIPQDRADLLPGVTLALAKIDKEKVQILQIGDAAALWEDKQGKIDIITGQGSDYNNALEQAFENLMKKHSRDRSAAWDEFLPILSDMRIRHINTGVFWGVDMYRHRVVGLLNGQDGFEERFRSGTASRDEIRRLLLFTDGFFFSHREALSVKDKAGWLLEVYKEGGLQAILSHTRRQEAGFAAQRHIDQAEASAVAIEF